MRLQNPNKPAPRFYDRPDGFPEQNAAFFFSSNVEDWYKGQFKKDVERCKTYTRKKKLWNTQGRS